MGLEPCLRGRDFVGAAHGGALARRSPAVPPWLDLLATVAALGGGGPLAAHLAEAAGRTGPAPVAGLGRSLPGRHLRDGQKRGSAVGKTRRGKGTKCVVVVDGQGIPLGAQLAPANVSEHKLAESTLARVRVPRPCRGRPRRRLRRVIADRGYDSDPMRARLRRQGTDLIVPYRANSVLRRYQDKRKLLRYRRRWKIERTFAACRCVTTAFSACFRGLFTLLACSSHSGIYATSSCSFPGSSS